MRGIELSNNAYSIECLDSTDFPMFKVYNNILYGRNE